LQQLGFSPDAPTAWLLEGLIGYLEKPDALRLLQVRVCVCARVFVL